MRVVAKVIGGFIGPEREGVKLGAFKPQATESGHGLPQGPAANGNRESLGGSVSKQ